MKKNKDKKSKSPKEEKLSTPITKSEDKTLLIQPQKNKEGLFEESARIAKENWDKADKMFMKALMEPVDQELFNELFPELSDNYILTKTKIIYGQTCKKKLWFDFREPIINDSSRIRLGNRFEKIVKKKYEKDLKILDLSNKDENSSIEAIEKTQKAIENKDVDLIYEGHFLKFDTFVRTDILKRNEKGWDLYEIKATGDVRETKGKLKGEFQDKYIKDVAIQAYIAESCGIKLTSVNIIYVNKDFVYLGNQNYQDLDKYQNITNEVSKEKENIIKDIELFKKFKEEEFPSPKVSMGSHCKGCNYLSKCKSLLPDDTIAILPRLSQKKKEKFESKNILRLQDINLETAENELTPTQLYIYKVHISGKEEEFSKEKFKREMKGYKEKKNGEVKEYQKFEFPYYFMDFEFVGQVVPLIKNTRPLVPLLFQWSVHKWNSLDEEIKLEDKLSFLKFQEEDMEKNFIEKLLKAVGKTGTIFCHKASAEITQLNNLKKYNFPNLANQIDPLIKRIRDTKTLVEKCFYSPKMKGKFGLKEVIKAIPKSNTDISYGKDDGLEGGTGAELAWVICTDPNTSNEEIENQKKLLIEYCAKDTFAMHDIVKYLHQKYTQEF